MSRGKNGFRRGNKTLAWYLDIPDNKQDQERDDTPSPSITDRKSSVDSDSQSSGNSLEKPPSVGENEGARKRDRKNRSRPGRPSSQQPAAKDPTLASSPPDVSVQSESVTVIPQQFSTLPVGVPKDRDSYFYYDVKSDGFYYEQNGSRGWRKRNPKLHGNPPLSVGKPVEENSAIQTPQAQTIEKKVYVPVPVPVYTSSSKFFPPPTVGTQNTTNIKYYDAATDGYFFEMASADGWRRRQPANQQQLLQQLYESQGRQKQKPELEPSSLTTFPPLGRDLSVGELEDLVLSNVKNPTNNSASNLLFASVVGRGLSQRGLQTTENEYPSSASTVSSSVSDDVTPPPAKDGTQPHFNSQSKDQLVGSFEEPYEFYWSDNEKTDQTTADPASSVSSADDGTMSAYFNQLRLYSDLSYKSASNRVKRPSSLKIADQLPVHEEQDTRDSRFNVDQFIADLPGGLDNEKLISTLTSACTPFSTDNSRPSFNFLPTKESPIFTPVVAQSNSWARSVWDRKFEQKAAISDLASADIEQKMMDIEKIWL